MPDVSGWRDQDHSWETDRDRRSASVRRIYYTPHRRVAVWTVEWEKLLERAYPRCGREFGSGRRDLQSRTMCISGWASSVGPTGGKATGIARVSPRFLTLIGASGLRIGERKWLCSLSIDLGEPRCRQSVAQKALILELLVTSDAGALLLGATDRAIGVIGHLNVIARQLYRMSSFADNRKSDTPPMKSRGLTGRRHLYHLD